MNSKLKQKIAKWFDITTKDIEMEYPESAAKKFGDQKGVVFELDLLVHTYCSVNEWASGEGFDMSWETLSNTKTNTWEDKLISLHATELECMLACFNYLKYFESDRND